MENKMSNTYKHKRTNKAKKVLRDCIEDRTGKRTTSISWIDLEVDYEYDVIHDEYNDAVDNATRHGNNRKYYAITKKKDNRSARMKAREQFREMLEQELILL